MIRLLLAAATFAAISAAPAALVSDDERPNAQLSASFYVDASCLLTIDQRTNVGQTVIDVKVADGESRTFLHCDTEDGQRLTILARGVTLGRYERTPLLALASIEDGANGMIAWLTNAGVNFPDESTPRRYVTQGDVFVTEAPQVQVAGMSLNVDRRAFAQVAGVLENVLSHPGGGVADDQ